MAVTELGRDLTEAHRLAQVEISAETQADVLAIFRGMLDPVRLDATFPEYARQATLVAERDHRRSTALATAYLETFREAEGARRPLDIRQADGLLQEQTLTSLLVTGPVEIKRATRQTGGDLEKATERGLVATLGAVKRLALQGSRDTIVSSINADPEALGVSRVTDGQPCYFCAMLAGRGAVYKSEETASFNPHDGCGCQPEAVFRRKGYLPPGRGKEFSDLYREIPGGLSPADSRRAFRGLYETGKVPKKFLPDA
jgi:hypothetical protein